MNPSTFETQMRNFSVKQNVLSVLFVLLFVGASKLLAQEAGTAATATQNATTEVVLASEINWKALNPARGDRSPQAGTLWGNQTEDGESGFLVKFVDGFSSPPHIHNITYRGVVIGGMLHNDDPDAEPMWMKEGSYWTQPAGEVHITSARGSSIGYVEIQSGPYLVKPAPEAFDNGEKPVNVDASNIVWLNSRNASWIKEGVNSAPENNAEMTFLWGSLEGNSLNGSMLKLPAGFSGKITTESASLKLIVIKGKVTLCHSDGKDNQLLIAGSYLGSAGKSSHHLSVDEKGECIVYVRVKGKYAVEAK